MSVKLLKNVGWLLVLNLISKPLWIIAENKIQNTVGHADFGVFSAYFAWALIWSPLADLGLNQYLTKAVAQNQKTYFRLLPQFLGLKTITSFVYFLGVVLLGIAFLGSGLVSLQWLVLCALIQIAVGWLMGGRAIMQAYQRFTWDGIASVADKTLLILAIIYLSYVGCTAFEYGIYTLLTTCIVAITIWVGLLYRKRLPVWRFSMLESLQIIQKSFPLALITVLFTLNEHLSKLFIYHFLGDEANGLYAGAFRWFAAFSMYLWTVLPVFYAKFAKEFTNTPESQQKTFNVGMVIVALPVIWVVNFIFFYGEILFYFFDSSTPAQIALMSGTLKVLSLALLVNGIFNIFSTYLTATGSEKYVNYLLVFAILAGGSINIIFLPQWGIVAAAVALLSAFSFLSIGYLYYFKHKTLLSIPYRILGRLGVVVAGLAGSSWGFTYLPISWLWACCLGIFVFIALCLLLRFDRYFYR